MTASGENAIDLPAKATASHLDYLDLVMPYTTVYSGPYLHVPIKGATEVGD